MDLTNSRLVWVDWAVILGFIGVSLATGVILSRRGRRSVRDYFASGGSTPWWLLGTSMVATTFAADTPLTLSGWVVTKGIAQNWFWWCQIPVTMLGVFFIARLWRRAELVTDMELVYLRYSGRSANMLRGIKAAYLALVYGCLVIGWVNLAMTKIVQLTLPTVPRVAVVDEVLQWTYLHTPLSNEISAPVREAIRRGDVDPLRLYYDEWTLPSQPNRGQVLADVRLVFERISVIEQRLTDSERPLTSSVEKDLRAYLAGLRNGPYLDRLDLTERSAEMGRLLHSDALSPADSAQDRLLPLRLLYDVHQVISAVGKLKIILLLFVIVIAYTVISGLWGVLVTDFIQFWIAMVGCIALAVLAVNRLGGLDAIME
ncbi:MAG: hypothetical protein GY842_16745, partial [bacterium]|nr:hypothetical protein [bacterium]